MATLEQHMMALAAQAHWRPPVADAQGVYRFSLEGDLAFAVFSSDGRVAVARGIVTPLPAASAAREELLERAAHMQAGAFARRCSTLACESAGQSLIADEPEEDSLILFRSMELEDTGLAAHVRDFVNDLAWWKAALATPAEGPAPSVPPSFFVGGGV